MAGIYSLLKILEMIIVFIYSAKFIKEKNSRKNIVICFAIGIIFEVFLAIWQLHAQSSIGGMFYLLGERFFTSETPGIANASINSSLVLRPYATFPHPNVLAGYLLLSQVMLIGFLRELKGKVLYFVFSAIVFCSIGIALSLSRVTIILEGLVVFYYLPNIFNKINKIKQKAIFLIIVGVISLFLFPLVFSRILNTSTSEDAILQRSSLISDSIKLINKNPVTGVGINNFLNELSYVKDSKTPLQPVHNILILLAVEMGIPIAFGILIIYISLFKSSLVKNQQGELARQEKVILIAAIALLSLFDHYFRTLQQGQLILAVVLGFIYGSGRGLAKHN